MAVIDLAHYLPENNCESLYCNKWWRITQIYRSKKSKSN